MKTDRSERNTTSGALLLSLLVASCTGTLAGTDDDRDDALTAGDGDSGGDGDAVSLNDDPDRVDQQAPPECPTEEPFVGTSVIRRMTNHQYNRTALLLFGDESNPAESFPAETREEGYDNQAGSQHIQQPQVIAWESAAGQLAERAVSSLDSFLGCDTGAEGVDSCFSSALPALLLRTLRTTPSEEDIAAYQGLYDALRADANGPRSVELVTQAMLMSPRFLFQVELGTEADNGTYRLDGFEIAARLSFQFWNQAPDQELLEAAADGSLDNPEGIAEQARRLVEDPRAGDVVQDFHAQWIHLSEIDNMVVPDGFDSDFKEAARKEIEWYISDWFEQGSGEFSDLLTSPRALVDSQLAAFYGVDGVDGETVVDLPEGERSGLLTRAVFLGTHIIPPTRGDFILARVLCSPVPPLTIMPPAPPDLGETATTRERFEKHSEDPCARGCHGVLDPVGFAFEHYSSSGEYRTTENGQPVDSATELTLPGDTGVNGPVADALELSEKVADSYLTADCLGENWFRYAYGRPAVAQDDCSLASMQETLRDSGNVTDLLVSLTQTDAFRFIRKEGL